jgi:glycosyltransferase involved in cell wall biosynthesis
VTAPHVRCISNITENDLIGEYRTAWVYCMPSSYEGFGVPVIEAMACGTPVVAIDNAGSREIIENNRNGLLCGPDSLGERLITALERQEMRDSLVREGLETAKRYDMRLVAEKYEEIYKKVVAGEN